MFAGPIADYIKAEEEEKNYAMVESTEELFSDPLRPLSVLCLLTYYVDPTA